MTKLVVLCEAEGVDIKEMLFPSPLHENGVESGGGRKKRRPNCMAGDAKKVFPPLGKKNPEFSFTLKAGKLIALL